MTAYYERRKAGYYEPDKPAEPKTSKRTSPEPEPQPEPKPDTDEDKA